MTALLRNISLLGLLVVIVLSVNIPVISFDMMYPEEPLMFVANQKIHHINDLLRIYLHPQLLHQVIPFFRPSGHFLIYQLLTPVIGWHQTKIFTAINLLFLAMTGFYMIRLYSTLFRGYWIGGLIGFAVYLAHPSLFLVKASVLHFEFAHTFFVALGLYYFVIFCQKNDFSPTRPFKLSALTPLCLALLFYIIAVTFKESSVMLGGVYIAYLCIALYQGGSLIANMRRIITNKQLVELLLLLCAITIFMGFYVTSAWPKANHPLTKIFLLTGLLSGMKGFTAYLFNWHIMDLDLIQQYYFAAKIYFGSYMAVIMTSAVVLTITTGIMLLKDKKNTIFRKPFIFLCVAALLYLIIPFGWGAGYPWHFNLSLMMLSLLFGFSAEYVATEFSQAQAMINKVGAGIAVFIAFTSFYTNERQVEMYKPHLPTEIIHQAMWKPPVLNGQLRKGRYLIVEDSYVKNSYSFGASFYPFSVLYQARQSGYVSYMTNLKNYFLEVDPNYSGSLFKLAYQQPDFKEQVIPYQIDHLELVITPLLYQWLQHYPDIYYIRYDKKGGWHDLTDKFKQNLLAEKARRGLNVRHYRSETMGSMIAHELIRSVMLPSGDETACQYFCDLEKGCQSFRFTENKPIAKCEMLQ